MKPYLTALLLAGSLLASPMLFAVSLESSMQSLQQNYRVLSNATDSTTALNALTQMKHASDVSKRLLPMALQGASADHPQVKQYHAMYEQLNALIDRAISLAQAGKLAEAKQVAKGIDYIKKQGHSQFQ